MKIENTNLNIPSMSVGSVVSSLCDLYADASKANISFKALLTPFLWGPAGVGKSDGIRELAARLATRTGGTVHVTDIRLLLFSPIDLRGCSCSGRTQAVYQLAQTHTFRDGQSN